MTPTNFQFYTDNYIKKYNIIYLKLVPITIQMVICFKMKLIFIFLLKNQVGGRIKVCTGQGT